MNQIGDPPSIIVLPSDRIVIASLLFDCLSPAENRLVRQIRVYHRDHQKDYLTGDRADKRLLPTI